MGKDYSSEVRPAPQPGLEGCDRSSSTEAPVQRWSRGQRAPPCPLDLPGEQSLCLAMVVLKVKHPFLALSRERVYLLLIGIRRSHSTVGIDPFLKSTG